MLGIETTTTRKGPGLKSIMSRVVGMKGYTKVGFPSGGPRHKDSLFSVAQIAMVNEYGSPVAGIPARPFMRQAWSAETVTQLRYLQVGLLSRIGKGILSEKQALGILGEYFTGRVKNSILTGNFAPNSPATEARKGGTKPLIDTAQMLGSVTHKEVI